MISLAEFVPGYQGRGIAAPISGNFSAGSMTAVVGANGSGKSTLLKTLLGLMPPVSRHGLRHCVHGKLAG